MDSNPPSFVHTQETNLTPSTSVPYARIQRSKCHEEFIATQLLYRAFDAVEGSSREERLLKCRSYAWFVRERSSGLVRVAANHCRLRWCPLCSRSRSGFISHQVKEWLRGTKQPKLLTLTLKHSNRDLSAQIEHIYRSFRDLRRSKWWKRLCYGGMWFFQITFNPLSKQWHPHIHILLDSEFIPYLKLKQKWYYYTSGSDVIDIRGIFNSDKTADYVSRYAARPHLLKDLPIKSAMDLVSVLHGKRMCGSWGSGKVISLSPYNAPKEGVWDHVGDWTTVHEMAKFNISAKEILKAYHSNQPLDPEFNLSGVDSFIADSPCFDHDSTALDPIPPPPMLF